jgi:hypothetical protein
MSGRSRVDATRPCGNFTIRRNPAALPLGPGSRADHLLPRSVRRYFGTSPGKRRTFDFLGFTQLLPHVIHSAVISPVSWRLYPGRSVNPESCNINDSGYYCDKTRSGRFTVKKKTQAKRRVRKLKTIRSEMRERLPLPVREQHHSISGSAKCSKGTMDITASSSITAPWSGSGISSPNCGSTCCGGKVRGRNEPGNGSNSC